MTFSDWVSKWINQLAHIGWGSYLTLALACRLHFYSVLIMIAFAGLKEGVFDPLTETKTEQGSGWEDFAFWCAGIILGIGSAILFKV